MRRSWAVLVAIGCLAGCDDRVAAGSNGASTRASTRDQAGTPAADGVGSTVAELPGCAALKLPSKAYALELELGLTLAAGEEHEVCAIHQVGPSTIHLNSSEMMMSTGSHHGVLWGTSYETLPDTDRLGDPIVLDKAVPCEGSATSRYEVTGVVSGSQGLSNVTAAGVLPDNVAVTLPANSYVVTNLHLLNTQDTPTDACMKVGLIDVPGEQVEQEAGALFFYDPFIAVAANSSSSARMACPIGHDILLKSASSHMHKHGVAYSAKLLDGNPLDPDTHEITTLYETTQWNSPEDRIFDDPLAIGQDQWIDYHCDYQNQTDRDVAQGLETVDEMCMFMGMYWPYDRNQAYCIDSNMGSAVGSGGYQIGAGSMNGSGFMTCLLTAALSSGATESLCGYDECKNYEARYQFQSCFVSACPAVGKYARPYVNCFSAHSKDCSTSCAGQPTSCALSCLNQDNCKAEADALTNAQCD
jgi:hypothetical protein